MSTLYSFRRWLFRRLSPKRLAVYMYPGAEYTTLRDEQTGQVWGYVRIDRHSVSYQFTEICNCRPEETRQTLPHSGGSHQNSEM